VEACGFFANGQGFFVKKHGFFVEAHGFFVETHGLARLVSSYATWYKSP